MPEQNQEKVGFIGQMLGNARECWSELVVYEVLFKLLAAALIGPVSAALFSGLIALSGDVSLSNERIASFILSPLGVVTAAGWSILGYTTALAEQSGLLVIAASAERGEPRGALPSIWFGLRRTVKFAQLAAIQIFVYALVLLPLLGIAGLIYVMLLSGHDINFYLSQRPPEFLAAIGMGIALAVVATAAAAWLHIGWVFALPCCLLDDETPRGALRRSRQMVKGRFLKLFKMIALWFAASFLLGVLLLLLVRLISDFTVGQVGDNLRLLLPTLAILSALHALAVALVSFVSISAYSLMIVGLYREVRQEEGLDFATAVGQTDSPSLLQRYITRRRFAVGIAMAAFVIATAAAWGMLTAIQVEESFAITAHRGSSRGAPENSMAAFELAIEEGADFIELDVQETSDGHIVVFHDKDFMRAAGDPRKIWEVTLDDLADIDIGSSHDPQFADQRVPLLADVIRATQGKIKLNVELKFNGHQQQLPERVVAVIRELNAEDDCVISSLDQEGLKQVQSIAPEIKTGIITAVTIGNLAKTDADFLSVSEGQATLSLVQSAHSRNKEVHVWTVNDTDLANRLIDMGADNLLTDEPAMMVELRKQRSELSTAERLLLQSHRWLGD